MSTLEQAERLMRQGEFKAAQPLLLDIICENPDDLRAICNIGISYTESGENHKAIKALQHYINKDADNTYAWEALGCAQFRIGELKDARKSLLKALEVSPENASALRNLGILDGFSRRYYASLKRLQLAMRLCPNDYRTLFALNFTFKNIGKTEERKKVIERLLEMDIPPSMRKEVEIHRIKLLLNWE